MKVSRKKTQWGWTYFITGHVDQTEFANSINAAHPTEKEKVDPVHVIHGYSLVEKGPYGAGRLFFGIKEPKSTPHTFVLPGNLRGRKMATE